MADNQVEIVRLLNSINGGGPAEFFRLSIQKDATEWVARTLQFGTNIGVGMEVSGPIVIDILNEIRAVVVARIERERAKGLAS